MKRPEPSERDNPLAAIYTVVAYTFLFGFGYFRDWFGSVTGFSRYADVLRQNGDDEDQGEPNGKRFPLIIVGQQGWYTRRVFHRLRDCFDRPICSRPGAYIDIIPRNTQDNQKSMHVEPGFLDLPREEKLQKSIHAVNLGSYNYLGFADNWRETCGEPVLGSIEQHGLIASSSPLEAGHTTTHRDLEKFVANFLNQEDAIVFSMGYGTNATVLTSILGNDTVVISDSMNHTSIINGCRGGNPTIIPFKHNDTKSLEDLLQRCILCGTSYPKVASNEEYKPWKKIVVAIEGIYSMEGETAKLPAIRDVCKKYNAYIYLDEAHSIGALGRTGRGICEHTGVPFSDIDILMGTFSKSFAGMGGYVAGKKEIMDKIRATCAGQTSMSPLSTLVTKQVLTAFKIIDTPGGLGQQKIQALHDNANYFRKKLKQIGCLVLGDDDSPIIPVMLYIPAKFTAVSRDMLKVGVALVVVGYPATNAYEGRIRFCISAGHTKEQLRKSIDELDKIARQLNFRYEKSYFG